ncbi:uncharacterized protein LY79DRAFT_76260 [Colletotrichum navitas]|uniref:Uncharacterized protein n=1 Tax=Colletotrichum navitas TaxID=681940 RepID=A0AAD8V8T1_9PEZI|nr:uncharacterized protein LY79DRAFT_76260 [Colletotrichum navitas]KAK1596046.1 hypothetical protein LY79DRAFT_76260 [Colletotrichum navitas]
MPLVVASWAEEEGLCSEVNVRTLPSCSPKAFPMPGRCLVSPSLRPCPALPRPLVCAPTFQHQPFQITSQRDLGRAVAPPLLPVHSVSSRRPNPLIKTRFAPFLGQHGWSRPQWVVAHGSSPSFRRRIASVSAGSYSLGVHLSRGIINSSFPPFFSSFFFFFFFSFYGPITVPHRFVYSCHQSTTLGSRTWSDGGRARVLSWLDT